MLVQAATSNSKYTQRHKNVFQASVCMPSYPSFQALPTKFVVLNVRIKIIKEELIIAIFAWPEFYDRKYSIDQIWVVMEKVWGMSH